MWSCTPSNFFFVLHSLNCFSSFFLFILKFFFNRKRGIRKLLYRGESHAASIITIIIMGSSHFIRFCEWGSMDKRIEKKRVREWRKLGKCIIRMNISHDIIFYHKNNILYHSVTKPHHERKKRAFLPSFFVLFLDPSSPSYHHVLCDLCSLCLVFFMAERELSREKWIKYCFLMGKKRYKMGGFIWLILKRISFCFVVPFAGPGGRSLIEIQRASGATIQISKKGMFVPGTRNRIVTITGQPHAVTFAHFLIEQKISEEETKRAHQNTLTSGIMQ